MESVNVRVPKTYHGLQVQWFAVPIDMDAPADAWLPDQITDQPMRGELETGIWDVTGDAGDTVFNGQIEVMGGAKNNFVIPYSAKNSPSGPDVLEVTEEFDGFACDSGVACQIEHAETGVTFPSPPEWRAETPHFCQTAVGALYGDPTITFYGPEMGDVIELIDDIDPKAPKEIF